MRPPIGARTRCTSKTERNTETRERVAAELLALRDGRAQGSDLAIGAAHDKASARGRHARRIAEEIRAIGRGDGAKPAERRGERKQNERGEASGRDKLESVRMHRDERAEDRVEKAEA